MKLTPENFVDGIQTIQFEHKGELWFISYSEKVREGNGWSYLKPKLLHGPVAKTLVEVSRNLSEDEITIISA